MRYRRSTCLPRDCGSRIRIFARIEWSPFEPMATVAPRLAARARREPCRRQDAGRALRRRVAREVARQLGRAGVRRSSGRTVADRCISRRIVLPICRSAAFGLLAAEQAGGDPAVDPRRAARAAPRGPRGRPRRVRLLAAPSAGRVSGSAGRISVERQRQLRVGRHSCASRAGSRRKASVEHAPRHALQHLIAPALGLEHARVGRTARRRQQRRLGHELDRAGA